MSDWPDAHRHSLSDVGEWFVNANVIINLLEAYPPGKEVVFSPDDYKGLSDDMSATRLLGADRKNIPAVPFEELLDVTWDSKEVHLTYPERMAVVVVEEAWEPLYVSTELYEEVLEDCKGWYVDELFTPHPSLSLQEVIRIWRDVHNF